MNKQVFKENLLKTVEEIKVNNRINIEKYLYRIHPVKENGKKLNSKDDFMRLNILTEENIGGKELTIDEIVGVLAGLMPLVPIWIEVVLEEIRNHTLLFQLNCSMRFRKPSLLNYQETGHPSFKAIF